MTVFTYQLLVDLVGVLWTGLQYFGIGFFFGFGFWLSKNIMG